MSQTSSDPIVEGRLAAEVKTAGADRVQSALAEAAEAAERKLSGAARRAEKVLREGVETLRSQTRAYTEEAEQRAGEARRYVLERVRERPVTATMAGLGVGLLLGLLLSNRSK